MVLEELPINPSGEWSPRQAARVLDVLNPIAARRGVVFRQLDITTHNHPHRRVMLVAFCIQHDIAIAVDSICGWCELP
jgi:hypothetical protein